MNERKLLDDFPYYNLMSVLPGKTAGHIIQYEKIQRLFSDMGGILQDLSGGHVVCCVSLVPVAKWTKVGKYADEALAFAGKLDDKLASTRIGEGLQTARRKLVDRFSRGKETACGCPADSLSSKIKGSGKELAKISKKDVKHILNRHSVESMKQQLPYMLKKKSRSSIEEDGYASKKGR